MQQENKKCEKCQQDFVILADDIPFYEKMDLPLPTMCFECRFKYLLDVFLAKLFIKPEGILVFVFFRL